MGNNKFIDLAKETVYQYASDHLDKSDIVADFDVFVVWLCKTSHFFLPHLKRS